MKQERQPAVAWKVGVTELTDCDPQFLKFSQLLGQNFFRTISVSLIKSVPPVSQSSIIVIT